MKIRSKLPLKLRFLAWLLPLVVRFVMKRIAKRQSAKSTPRPQGRKHVKNNAE